MPSSQIKLFPTGWWRGEEAAVFGLVEASSKYRFDSLEKNKSTSNALPRGKTEGRAAQSMFAYKTRREKAPPEWHELFHRFSSHTCLYLGGASSLFYWQQFDEGGVRGERGRRL